MNDFNTSCKSSHHGKNRNWLKDVKQLKCELPFPDSKSYWDEVFTEIEKKYKRVRDPYPSLSMYLKSLTSPIRTQCRDKIKVKVPHSTTSAYKIKRPYSNIKSNKSDIKIDTINDLKKLGDECMNDLKSVLLSFASFKKIKNKNLCPRHKKLLLKRQHSTENSEYLFPEKHLLCPFHKSMYDKSIVPKIKNDKRGKEGEDLRKNNFKAAEHSKSISTDSSVVAEEYFDAGAKASTSESQSETIGSIGVKGKDFLSRRNLRFVSSQRSFRESKPSLADTSTKKEYTTEFGNIAITKKKEFLIPKKNLEKLKREKLTLKDESKKDKWFRANETEASKILLTNTNTTDELSYFDKKYARKALNRINELYDKNNVTALLEKLNLNLLLRANEENLKKKLNDTDDDDDDDDDEEEEELSKQSAKEESVNIASVRSSYQNLSGLDSKSQMDELTSWPPSSESLKGIPKTKMLRRGYVDKCYGCLHKSLDKPNTSIRELKFTLLDSIVDNMSNSGNSSSSGIISSLYDNVKYVDSRVGSGNREDVIINTSEISEDTSNGKSLTNIESKGNVGELVGVYNLRNGPATAASPSNDLVLGECLSDKRPMVDAGRSRGSCDRAKASSLSNQSSSDFEETEYPPEENELSIYKSTAPCHAPVIWRRSLEPLRALKLKRRVDSRARTGSVTSNSNTNSDADSVDDANPGRPSELVSPNKEMITSPEAMTPDPDLPKKQKQLVKMKSAIDIVNDRRASLRGDDRDLNDKRKQLKRSKTAVQMRLDEKAIDSRPEDLPSSDSQEENIGGSIEESESTDFPYIDLVSAYRANSFPSSIMSAEDVAHVIEECVKDGYSASSLLEKLKDEFLRKLEHKYGNANDNYSKKYLRLAINLFKVLVESRRYVKANIFKSNLEFSSKQPPMINTRLLRRVLPEKSYDLIAPILGKSTYYKIEKKESTDSHANKKLSRADVNLQSSLIVNDGTHFSAQDPNVREKKINPYALFLKKPRRKAVIWRPLRKEDLVDYDPEATLKMRAARLLRNICTEFCEWINMLGGSVKLLDEETLEDMFEINFTSNACQATQIIIKEMPTIPTSVVEARNCSDPDQLQNTRKQIFKDMKVEKREKRTFAFNQTLPRGLRFVPPTSNVADVWLHCENIPTDVKSLDVIWNGIMDLDSVQTFVKYLKKNPKIGSSKFRKNLFRRPFEKSPEKSPAKL